VGLARGLYGAALLLAPRRALGSDARALDGSTRVFARLLGLRNLAEASLLARHRTRGWALAGAAVDGAHAATMALLAALDSSRRRVAVRSGLVAAGFAALGLAARGSRTPAGSERSAGVGPADRRSGRGS
jgi:hypothetical protein